MKERDDSKPLTQFIQVDDACWGGKKNDGIRGAVERREKSPAQPLYRVIRKGIRKSDSAK